MSYTNHNYHIIFSTKNHKPLLDPNILPRLVKYLGGIVRELDGTMIEANGPEDHVHIVATLGPKMAMTDVLRVIKTNSSKWVHESFPQAGDFQWQDGYSSFTVSHSQMQRVVSYVRSQQEHHKKQNFQEELVAMLKLHEIDFDPRYISV